jgi:hypothetical protein
MGTDTELRAKIAEERAELGVAVVTLRKEVDHAADVAKKVAIGVGAAAGVAAAIRVATKIARR